MKQIIRTLTSVAVIVLAFSMNHSASAQAYIGIGPSTMFYELGVSAAHITSGGGTICLWSALAGTAEATDISGGNPAFTDTGRAWVTWTGVGSNCNVLAPGSQIFAYLEDDSMVALRCLFNEMNSGSCAVRYPVMNIPPPASQIFPGMEVPLPPVIFTALNNSPVNYAGTDIRPEDAEFVITRATGGPTAVSPPLCATVMTQYTGGVGQDTQYLYLGYHSHTEVVGFQGGWFHILNFSLPSVFSVTSVGAAPILVLAHGPSVGGFSSTSVSDLNRATLGLYLDGTVGLDQDAADPYAAPISGGAQPVTVFVPPPNSGVYSTMEYNIPNNVELQSSQDVGLNQVDIGAQGPVGNYNRNCNAMHTAPQWNLANLPMGTLAGNLKERTTDNAQEIADVFGAGNSNALGYAFWNVRDLSNANTTANNKYLSVDGIDPLGIGTAGVTGGIPTSPTALANVTLRSTANGTYPIWSLLRIVTPTASTMPEIQAWVNGAQQVISAADPDWIPYASSGYSNIPNMALERAHFTPPGIYASGTQPTPQNAVDVISGLPLFIEAGGDVGGLPIPYQVDHDYCLAYNGGACPGTPSFTGTATPSSSRRQ